MRCACAILLCVVSASGCKCGPCIPPGKYDLVARRASGSHPPDGGVELCPEQLNVALEIGSANTAHFAIDGGPEGDCTLLLTDYRPKYECQVLIRCSAGSQGQPEVLTAFSFNHDGEEFIDGYGGVGGVGAGLSYQQTDGGCAASYSFAAAPRSSP